jgi:hypothetical protein
VGYLFDTEAGANTVGNGVNALQSLAFDAAAARAQIDRITQSKTFEASDVHRRLLQYLSEKSIAGEADRLKEYTIGIEAFGKPESYDPKQDSIVRLQVGRLRQKLAVYYQTEGVGDPIVVNLPKGAYRLVFDAAAADLVPAVEHPPRHWTPVLAIGLAVMSAWAIVATVMAVRSHRQAAPVADAWTPELEALWQPFLDSSRATMVCLGTPLFVRFPNFGFFRDPKSNDWQEIEKSDRIGAARNALGKEMLPSYAFTGAGEASAAFLLGRLLATRKKEMRITRSSILSWQQIADEDVIFLGPPKFNLQLDSAALTHDITVEPGGIRNRKPAGSEPAFLEDRIQPGRTSEGETHALISRTAGPSGAGELLVIAGNASADTLAAAEWLTQPWRAKELAAKLRGSSGEIPRHFQAVIQVEFKQGIPVQSSYVYHHVLP